MARFELSLKFLRPAEGDVQTEGQVRDARENEVMEILRGHTEPERHDFPRSQAMRVCDALESVQKLSNFSVQTLTPWGRCHALGSAEKKRFSQGRFECGELLTYGWLREVLLLRSPGHGPLTVNRDEISIPVQISHKSDYYPLTIKHIGLSTSGSRE